MVGSTAVRWLGFVVALAGLSGGAFFAYTSLTGAAVDPFDGAGQLVPADTHVFVGVNTDFGSAPWQALPDLLTRLGIQQDFLDERDKALREAGLDYGRDVEPALGTIRAFAAAVQVSGDDDAALVAVIDSRDPDEVAQLLERLVMQPGTDITRTTSRDGARGLDVVSYTGTESGPSVVGRRGDLLYLGEQLAHIQGLIDRHAAAGPIADLQAYKDLRTEGPSDALAITFVNGALFSAIDSTEAVDALAPTLGVDPRGMKVLVTTSATTGGFEVHGKATSSNGFGRFALTPVTNARLVELARSTPANAQLFIASVGLAEAITSAVEAIGASGFVDAEGMLDELHAMSGVDVRNDVLPLLGDAYSVSGRIEDAQSFEGWFLFQTESSDPTRLAASLQQLFDAFERDCNCTVGVAVEPSGNTVRVRWPAEPLPATSLADDSGFTQTRSRLPEANTGLFYLNAGALPPSALAELGADSPNLRLERLLGIGAASAISSNLAEFSVVVPVGGGP